jgi:predicted DNA-binding antitoxin AbrB/MazE fold protein
MNVDAIYDHGVFRPVEPVVLPEGARVHLQVEEEWPANSTTVEVATEANGSADYKAWLDSLVGRWKGDFVRGDEGSFETREPLS